MTKPLGDITVVELTQMIAGSFAGMNLADLGAEVIKVEPPGGEIARNVEPSVGGSSFYYASVNRGKRSVVIDLKSEDGRDLFLDIVEDADILLENFTPGTVEGLGIDYETVSNIVPDIIYCSLSAYGQTGPRRDEAGIDTIVQAHTGIASMTRDLDGAPLRCGLPLSDLTGALYAVQGIFAALRERDRTGTGDYIDVSLADSVLSLLTTRAGYSFATGEPYPSIARHHNYFAPEGIYPTADGYLQISAITQAHWERLCRALNADDLVDEPSFASPDKRVENRDELITALEDILLERPSAYWIERLREFDVPISRINDVRSVWDDEQTRAREMQTHVVTPEGEDFPSISYPVKHRHLDSDESEYIGSLGADTRAVLQEVGYDSDALSAFEAKGVIVSA